jgi:hypothetical protein
MPRRHQRLQQRQQRRSCAKARARTTDFCVGPSRPRQVSSLRFSSSDLLRLVMSHERGASWEGATSNLRAFSRPAPSWARRGRVVPTATSLLRPVTCLRLYLPTGLGPRRGDTTIQQQDVACMALRGDARLPSPKVLARLRLATCSAPKPAPRPISCVVWHLCKGSAHIMRAGPCGAPRCVQPTYQAGSQHGCQPMESQLRPQLVKPQ